MRYRPLGSTGLMVSELGFGTCEQVDQAFSMEFPNAKCLPWDKVLGELKKYFQPIPCDRCQRCICPYGTEIHTVIHQYNYFFMGKDYGSRAVLYRNGKRQCNEI